MFSINAETTEKNPNIIDKVMDSLQGLVEIGVVSGFPKGRLNTPHYKPENPNEGPGPSIIDVAIWNNYGIGVPRRDFMTPASKRWMKFFSESLSKVSRDIQENKIDPQKFLGAMGQKGSDIISQEIIALSTPPNSPVTIAKKGSSNPLVDSGDMSRATTWQIRKRGNK